MIHKVNVGRDGDIELIGDSAVGVESNGPVSFGGLGCVEVDFHGFDADFVQRFLHLLEGGEDCLIGFAIGGGDDYGDAFFVEVRDVYAPTFEIDFLTKLKWEMRFRSVAEHIADRRLVFPGFDVKKRPGELLEVKRDCRAVWVAEDHPLRGSFFGNCRSDCDIDSFSGEDLFNPVDFNAIKFFCAIGGCVLEAFDIEPTPEKHGIEIFNEP